MHFVLGLVLMFVAGTAHAACTNPTEIEGAIVYNADQNVPQICIGSTWFALGALNPAAGGGACTNPSETEGAIVYNNDFDVLQYCDGENWRAVIASPGGGGFLGFTDLTNQPTSTLTTSNILQVNLGGSISISGDGTPEYRICADDTCSSAPAFTAAPGTITGGDFLQLRLTSTASNSTMNSATVAVGTGSDQWDVSTGAGCGVSSTGLAGYWKFDEGTGTSPADSSGSGNTLGFPGGSGNPSWTTSGKISNALIFDGNDTVFRTSPNNFPTTGDYTVATWFKPTTNFDAGNNLKRLVNTMGTGGNWSTGGINLLIGSDFGAELACYFVNDGGGDSQVDSSVSYTSWTAGIWYHAACAFDSSTETFTLYVNGVQVDQDTGVGIPDDPGGQFFVAAGDFGNAEGCDCTLDDVRIYNRALSGPEMSALYNGGAGCSD
jgi:hypothetical protein